jgi:hypothetical protein
MSENNSATAIVAENKFNGTSTLEVIGVESREDAKEVAKQFSRDEYGHYPTRIVAEKRDSVNETVWDVIVAQHSSGSLKDSKEYEL